MTRNGTAAAIVDRMSAVKQSMQGKLVDAGHAASKGASAAIDTTSKLIRHHPFVAIGIAFGVGYLIMRIARSR